MIFLPTKAELSEKLSDYLGLDVDFSGMKKDDLEKLFEEVESGDLAEDIVKREIQERGQKWLGKMLEDWSPGKLLFGGNPLGSSEGSLFSDEE